MAKHLTSSGINFGDNAHEGGMSAEVLNDYEQGTWTPGRYGGSSGTTQHSGGYTRIGESVHATAKAYSGTGGFAGFTSIPFTVGAGGIGSGSLWGMVGGSHGAHLTLHAGDNADQFTFENELLQTVANNTANKWYMLFSQYYTF